MQLKARVFVKDTRSYSKFTVVMVLWAFISVCGMTFAQTLLWSDEFDGTSLDTSKWVVVNQEDWDEGGVKCWYAPKNVEVSGGTLKLHSYEETYGSASWTGAKLESKYYPQYKYLEARVRHSLQDAHIWSAWWTVGWTGSGWQWPPEFDIFEFMIDWQSSPFQTYHWTFEEWDIVPPTGVDETEWHTYGVYWTATEKPVFYLDGIKTYQSSGEPLVAQIAALLLLSSSPNRDNHPSGCPLGDFEVDYVRVYDAPPIAASNLALDKPASASSVESGYPAEDAVDGGTASRWASDWSDPQWLMVDLEDTYTIDEVNIYWEWASARNYKVQIADSPTGPWTDCASVTNNWVNEHWKTLTFAPQTGRYVRVYCTARTTIYGYSIFELEVYQDCEGADIDNSGVVGLADLSILFSYWLEPNCNLYNDCDGADIYDDNKIDFSDFSILAEYWSCNTCSAP